MTLPAWIDRPLPRAFEDLSVADWRLRVRVSRRGNPALLDMPATLELLTHPEPGLLERIVLETAAGALGVRAAELELERAILVPQFTGGSIR